MDARARLPVNSTDSINRLRCDFPSMYHTQSRHFLPDTLHSVHLTHEQPTELCVYLLFSPRLMLQQAVKLLTRIEK